MHVGTAAVDGIAAAATVDGIAAAAAAVDAAFPRERRWSSSAVLRSASQEVLSIAEDDDDAGEPPREQPASA
jgi:hypothetical protein